MLPDVRTPQEIIQSAIDKYKPIQIALLFSGGHDSLVNTHLSSSILKSLGYNFVVYHGDTTMAFLKHRIMSNLFARNIIGS